jgi:hypothetical protein
MIFEQLSRAAFREQHPRVMNSRIFGISGGRVLIRYHMQRAQLSVDEIWAWRKSGARYDPGAA